MNIYEIELGSWETITIIAKDFEDAVKQAIKYLEKIKEQFRNEKAISIFEITRIEKTHSITSI